MKRKITFLTSIFIIAMMLFTSNVFASTTFTYNGATYVIEEVKLKLDSLSDDLEFLGMDKDNNCVIGDVETEIIYKVNENESVEMSTQEILDFMYYSGFDTHNYEENLNIYQTKMPTFGWFDNCYFKTEDKVFDNNKTYYELVTTEGEGYVSTNYEPTNDLEFASDKVYYEKAFFVTPKTAKIDENISYYLYDNNESCMTKVENPNEKEAYMYAIIGESSEVSDTTKIGQMTQDVYDRIFPELNCSFYIHYDEVNNEIYILINYEDTNKSIIYKADGTIVAEYDSLMRMDPLGNNFFIVTKCDEYYEMIGDKITIIDTNGYTVFESEKIPYLNTLINKDNTIYLKAGESWEVSGFYNMYEYKLLSQDNQKYEGKELQIKTSGELNRLVSVKVNGTELDSYNYTKTSISTIITLKNDYLKTLALGTYTLELGYVDGTKIETKFVVDKLYISDTENEGNTGNASGSSNAGSIEGTTGGEAGSIIEEDKGDKDDTPKTGNDTENRNLGLHITLIIAIVGVIATRKK